MRVASVVTRSGPGGGKPPLSAWEIARYEIFSRLVIDSAATGIHYDHVHDPRARITSLILHELCASLGRGRLARNPRELQNPRCTRLLAGGARLRPAGLRTC
ncbi:hypothetical protein M404DRAFT_244949 [Pisolithus tinctorius Marx 270]|uniref:Uncharacterized protein n=1 Tax=Pisolithus tinctorius Marx 270 TaxID=870435 RepID=A0A0C3JG11_PISTI|nr:hypothetical protein M404DRAFT_244949 [Pisolithus tinctorius Marx 270]